MHRTKMMMMMEIKTAGKEIDRQGMKRERGENVALQSLCSGARSLEATQWRGVKTRYN